MAQATDRTESDRPGSPPEPASAGLRGPKLFGTVFVTGAAVIAIEIMGTRIVGPVFGVSLFVWSALLAVTLGSLAVGYYAGGVAVDRRPTIRLLDAVVAGSGVLLGVVPAVSHVVLEPCVALGPRGGPLVAATLLFAPSLVVLGAVGPIVVRLATTSVRATGHRVGGVYAVSTAGSLLGTLVTAFVLVPSFETDQILFGVALLLAALGAIPLAWGGRKAATLAILVPLIGAAVPKPKLPSGISILARAQSLYGLLEVIEDTNRNVRFLRSDHSVIGAQWLDDHAPAFSFIHLLEAIRFARPRATDMFEVGLGTGALPTLFLPRGIKVDVVEIDPTVVHFARKYFGFDTRGDVFIEDARTFLRRTERRYDMIVQDTFTGGSTPEHLLSVEVARRHHDLLRPGGVLALNFVGFQSGPAAEASRAVARTLRAVFPVVRVFRDSAPDEKPDEVANLVFFASDEPIAFDVPPGEPTDNKVLASFQKWEVLRDASDGAPITDRQNPLTRLQLATAEEHFVGMNELLPVAVWLQ